MNIAFVYMNNVSAAGRGAGYVVASIPDVHNVDFFDTKYTPISEVADCVVSTDYDVLMISTTTLFVPVMDVMIRDISVQKTIPILVGGTHVIVAGKELLVKNRSVDFVCLGEGETFIKEFVEKWGSLELFDISGLAYHGGDTIIENPIGLAEDLSALKLFPWKLFPRLMNERGHFNIHATRGCRYNCSYCCNGVYLKKYGKAYLRHRPVEDILLEITFLQSMYNPKLFYFADEELFSDKEYCRELFTAVKKFTGVAYGCMSRPESLDEDMINVMKETGCKYIAMGVECGDSKFRRETLNRSMTNAQIKDAFRLCKEAGFSTTSFNMIGYPVSYDDELCKCTLRLNEVIDPDIFQVTWFYPFPGTKMGDYCVANKLVDKKKILFSYHHGSVLKMHENKSSNAKVYLEALK